MMLNEDYRDMLRALSGRPPNNLLHPTKNSTPGRYGLKRELGIKAIGREIMGENGTYELREPEVSYNGILAHEMPV